MDECLCKPTCEHPIKERPVSPTHAPLVGEADRQMEARGASEFFGEKRLLSKWEAMGRGRTQKFVKTKAKEGLGESRGSEGFINVRLGVILLLQSGHWVSTGFQIIFNWTIIQTEKPVQETKAVLNKHLVVSAPNRQVAY